MADLLQTFKVVTSNGYLTNYFRDWLRKLDRDKAPIDSPTFTGNVGIGTNGPKERLDISGGAIRVGNSTTPANEGDGGAYFYKDSAAVINHAFGVVARVNSAERMRINSNGYLLVGYTTSNGAYKLQVNSQIFATNSTIATSDRKFKENELDITSGLDVVSALRPVSFDWKQGEGHDFVTHRDLGFIAQEVEAALTGKEYAEGIVKSVGSFKGMAYDKLIPILVKAIQEQQSLISDLTARIEALEV